MRGQTADDFHDDEAKIEGNANGECGIIAGWRVRMSVASVSVIMPFAGFMFIVSVIMIVLVSM